MRIEQIIRAAIPNASHAEVEHVLWGCTPFPFKRLTAQELFKAASGYRRASAKGNAAVLLLQPARPARTMGMLEMREYLAPRQRRSTQRGEKLMSMMSVMDPTGHTEVSWDVSSNDETEVAREMFTRMTERGYRAFRTDGKGGQGTRMTEFDPEAESLILIPHLQGG